MLNHNFLNEFKAIGTRHNVDIGMMIWPFESAMNESIAYNEMSLKLEIIKALIDAHADEVMVYVFDEDTGASRAYFDYRHIEHVVWENAMTDKRDIYITNVNVTIDSHYRLRLNITIARKDGKNIYAF